MGGSFGDIRESSRKEYEEKMAEESRKEAPRPSWERQLVL